MEIIQRKYANYILKPFLKRYLKKIRFYRYHQLKLKIYPGVFHPKYFFSTAMLVDFLNELSLNGKTFCEVGAGSGLLSFLAFQEKARVIAFDLNETAVKGLIENFNNNFPLSEDFKIHVSDLFDNVPLEKMDIVFINPPYFFKKAEKPDDLAWNCGENGEYFGKLFSQLGAYIHRKSEVYMILADNCEIEKITQMAELNQFNMVPVKERKIKWEKNFIFKLNFSGIGQPA
jgi:release factor glutamine methyltransferase